MNQEQEKYPKIEGTEPTPGFLIPNNPKEKPESRFHIIGIGAHGFDLCQMAFLAMKHEPDIIVLNDPCQLEPPTELKLPLLKAQPGYLLTSIDEIQKGKYIPKNNRKHPKRKKAKNGRKK